MRAASPTRILGPVEWGFGLSKAIGYPEDIVKKKTIFRCCNCCSLVLSKTLMFSYSGVRKDYSHTCRSCCSYIFLFSQEMAKDEFERPKRVRGPNKPKPVVTLWEAWHPEWCRYKQRRYDEDNLKWLRTQNRKRSQVALTSLKQTIST